MEKKTISIEEIKFNNKKGQEIGKITLEHVYDPQIRTTYLYPSIIMKYPIKITRQQLLRVTPETLNSIILNDIKLFMREVLGK